MYLLYLLCIYCLYVMRCDLDGVTLYKYLLCMYVFQSCWIFVGVRPYHAYCSPCICMSVSGIELSKKFWTLTKDSTYKFGKISIYGTHQLFSSSDTCIIVTKNKRIDIRYRGFTLLLTFNFKTNLARLHLNQCLQCVSNILGDGPSMKTYRISDFTSISVGLWGLS